MTLFLLVLALSLLLQTICQFAPHMDFQKVNEIMLGKSKYKVLRPTVHITRDHFKDFIQERDSKDFPGTKTLVDKNGIRHFWSGFEAEKPKSLRKDLLETVIPINVKKSDIKSIEVVNNNKDSEQVKEIKTSSSKETNILKKLRNKPQRKKKIKKSQNVKVDKHVLRKDDRKKVQTTFFCPFFGVITMISYID